MSPRSPQPPTWSSRLRARQWVAATAGVVVAAAVVVALAFDAGGGGEDRRARDRARRAAPLSPPPPVPAKPAKPAGTGREPAAEEDRPAQLGMPAPSGIRPGTPERALARFMEAWRDRQWERMATWTAVFWRRQRPHPGATLRARFGAKRLRGYSIVAKRPGRIISGMTVLIEYRGLKPRLQRGRLRLRVLREDRAGRLVESGGRWGVAPTFVRPL
jgi:hypothetical protein